MSENKIYKQTGGTCEIHAVANAVESMSGIAVPEEEIIRTYKKINNGKLTGMSLRRLLDKLKKEPLGGYFIDSYRMAYNKRAYYRKSNNLEQKYHYQRERSKIWQALQHPKQAVIFGLYTRAGKAKLPLDKNSILTPTTNKIIGGHAVFVPNAWRDEKRKLLGFVLENTWGDKWGRKGIFLMRREDFNTEVESAYIIKFK